MEGVEVLAVAHALVGQYLAARTDAVVVDASTKLAAEQMHSKHAVPQHIDPILSRVQKWGTLTTGFDARLANRPFLVFDFQALWVECNSARKSKTKTGRLASLASNP